MTLTAERLREALNYDPSTGIFTWRKKISRKVVVGARAGFDRGDGYVKLGLDGRMYFAHRLAWLYVYGEWPNGNIDHRDVNPSNNSIANLRVANGTENQANRRAQKNNKSGYKGVSWYPPLHRWAAFIASEFLGYYESAEEAHVAYCRAASERYGEFARAA